MHAEAVRFGLDDQYRKSQIPLRYLVAIWSQTGPKLVADMQRAGIWPVIYLASSELARASRSATSLGPVCDQIA